MAEDRLNRLNLFEALVFGIYGNWLISFLDKISFTKFPSIFNIFGEGYQIVCVGLSFSCLLILFAYSIFRPNAATKWFIMILYLGHVVGIYGAFFVEGLTIPNTVFLLIGFTLFAIIYLIELQRIKIGRRNRVNNPPAT